MRNKGNGHIYHIAQFGTYDLPSLGDTMFPVIFKLEMEKRFGEDNISIDLYSPFGTDHPYNHLPPVFSIDELEKNHKRAPYDCLIIGGGEFVHFLPVEYISVDNVKRQYQAGDLWRKPQLEAQKLGIPVFWNCVGVSRDFESEEEIDAIQDACVNLGYLSVRDKYSKLRLEKMAGVQNVHEVADMLWLFNRYFSKTKLQCQKEQLETEYSFLKKEYMVLQYGTSADYDKLGQIIERIRENYNIEIVLLSINYCHEDEEIVKKLKQKFDNFRVIDKKLDPVEIMSVIAGAKYFLGTSLHGNVTAMSYGVKNLCLDMYPSFVSKMDGLFEMLKSKELLLNGLESLYTRFEKLTEADFDSKIEKEISNIQLKLDAHFDKIADLIFSRKCEKYECKDMEEKKFSLHKSTISNGNNAISDICCSTQKSVEFYFEIQNSQEEMEGVIYETRPFIVENMYVFCNNRDIPYYFLNAESEDGQAVFENKCIYRVNIQQENLSKNCIIRVKATISLEKAAETKLLKWRLQKAEQSNYELEVSNKRLQGHVDYMVELEREYKRKIAEKEQEIEEKNRQIEEKNKHILEREQQTNQQIAEKNQQIKNKEGHIQQLLEVEREYEREKKSRTYRMALVFRRISIFFLPVNSKRRFLAKMMVKAIRHPRLMFHMINVRRIRNFFVIVKKEGMDSINYHYRLVEDFESSKLNPFRPEQFEITEIEESRKNEIEDYEKLTFSVYESPQVSIIIPVYNQFDYTYNCLESILRNSDDIQYEIIIADDCSTDLTVQLEEVVEGVRVLHNKKNLRFLLNCNQAAEEAKGKYIVFLNNDTQVQNNWLKPLVEILENDESVGMTGSKLVYSDGYLQEAGGIFWNDASAWNYGNRKNPDDPEYNYVKEVDYISGAAIMIRASLWKEIGGFDDRFAPAYYEDSDLAFEVRKHGYKVVYQPLSVVVHFEGVSNGTDINSGQKAYQVENQSKFYEKWADVLQKEHFPNGENVFLAKDRSRFKKHILVVDHYVPHYDKDAGGKCTYMYLMMFVRMGFKVTFIGDNFFKHEPYTTELNQHGIEVLYGNYYFENWKEWLKENLHYFDYVYLQRPHISIKYIDLVKEYSHAKIFYFAHDLHHLREYREYLLTKDEEKRKSSEHWKQIEFELFEKADVGHVVGNYEQGIMQKAFPNKPIRNIPLYIYEDIPKEINKDFMERKDLIYVGGFGHPPNVDAVLWFGKEVFPKVLKKYPDILWHVVGGKVPIEIQEMASRNIIVEGFLSDEELHSLYRNCRMAVVPLRVGAGVKGKVVEAAYYQVPLVTTTIGAEGLSCTEGNMIVEDDADRMAETICNIYEDYDRLKRMSDAGVEFIQKYFTATEAERVLRLDMDI